MALPDPQPYNKETDHNRSSSSGPSSVKSDSDVSWRLLILYIWKFYESKYSYICPRGFLPLNVQKQSLGLLSFLELCPKRPTIFFFKGRGSSPFNGSLASLEFWFEASVSFSLSLWFFRQRSQHCFRFSRGSSPLSSRQDSKVPPKYKRISLDIEKPKKMFRFI